MYSKDGTRLQNKGVNLIVCLIFWTLNDLCTTHSPRRLQCHRFRPEDKLTNPFFEDTKKDIESCKSRDIQYNGKMKKLQKDKQRSTKYYTEH
jgi:hypothetical protein